MAEDKLEQNDQCPLVPPRGWGGGVLEALKLD